MNMFKTSTKPIFLMVETLGTVLSLDLIYPSEYRV